MIYLCFLIAKYWLKKNYDHDQKRINILEHKVINQKLTLSLILVDEEQFLIIYNGSFITTQKINQENCQFNFNQPASYKANEYHQ